MAKKGSGRAKAGKAAKAVSLELSWITEQLRGLAVPIGEIEPDPDNTRKHDDANIRAIRASLREFGQRKPLVVNRTTKRIEAGNGTHQAALRLGWSHVAVVWVEDDPTAARGYAIADNRSAELAEWDEALLEQAIEGIEENDRALGLSLRYELLLNDLAGGAGKEEASQQMVPESFEVVVACKNEEDQQAFFEQMRAEGRQCRKLGSLDWTDPIGEPRR